MDIYGILSAVIFLAALFAYINHRFIKWPSTIGIMALSLACSVLIVLFGRSAPTIAAGFIHAVSVIDFREILMQFMLSFLLFAGAVHINAGELRKEKVPVVALATFGIVISTFLAGGASFYLFRIFGLHIPFIYCLLFGSLISPTDPIAVLGILKQAGIPKSLELKISGESLFNDGVAVVVFISITEIIRKGIDQLSAGDIALLFLREAGGGLLFGTLLGYAGFFALRSIDNYKVEVLITLAIVTAGYTLADNLHVSGPLAMVIAGIITGNKGRELAMSDVTRDYLGKFWEMTDEILNAILFMLIGFEILVIPINKTVLTIGILMIPCLLICRWLSVGIPLFLLRKKILFEKHALKILTWGGLRGGISVALALSLSDSMHRGIFVLITYSIVVFAILVQGLTIGRLSTRLLGK